MRKIGFAKFKETTKEILPKTYKVNEIRCQRRMFCTMINQYLSTKSKFNLRNPHLFKKDLLGIFEDKILSFFPYYRFKPEKVQKVFKIYIEESLLFNQYFKQSKNAKMRYMTSSIYFNPEFRMLFGYSHPATDLIGLIFNGKDIEMMLDLDEVFTRTIYNRIKKEKNKKVSLDFPYIHITQDGVKTRLHPRWKHVYPNNLQTRDSDIGDGFVQLKNEEINQCYLVYPKTDGFKKHITVVGESSQLKMVPYSFTFCNRQGKNNVKNRTFLR
ncbi:MAG: hypothetical protein U9N33_03000 [Campylobacterota bacterium]|nr:hypothetical protein [Campylobacterota bacterium]